MLQAAPPADSLRRALAEVFARPDYAWVPRFDLGDWMREQVLRLLDWIGRQQTAHPAAFKVVLTILIAVLAGLLIHMGYVVWRITRPTVHTLARAAGATGLRLEDARAHRERADELARAGRYAEALAHRFIALLLELERRRTPLFDFARTAPRGTPPAVLVVLQPPRSLYAAELAQVVEFVRAGGRVVAAGSGGGITGCVGWRTKNEEVFLLRDSFPVVSPVPTLSLPPVTDFLKPWRDDVADESRLRVRGGPNEELGCAPVSQTAEDILLHVPNGRPPLLRHA